ncbi:hypothetical protein HFD88_004348 [Aspergillus terreus]|nr:hypothetical protein HFD88_004348 [Aspergillus terreus]
MLVSPMPPQTSLHYPRPPPPSSSSAEDKDASSSSHAVMTSTLPTSTQSPSAVSHSNMACPLATATTPSHRRPSVSRPKLTLQTSSLPRTFGSSSTGLSLSLAGGATASPTVRNTFKNAYDVPVPSSATASPSKSTNHRFTKPSSPYPSNNPYQLPLGVKSILRNSPLEPATRSRSLSVATTPNGLQPPRRVFFPAKKQVSYRQPLEEEIRTVRYTARHSDLTAESDPEPRGAGSDEDSDSTASLTLSDASTSEDDVDGKRRGEGKKRKHHGADRQVRAVALMDGLQGENYSSDSVTPQTPCQARSKRRCEWRWTLGPLELRGGSDASQEPTKTALPEEEATSQPSCDSSDTSSGSPHSPDPTECTTSDEIDRVSRRQTE